MESARAARHVDLSAAIVTTLVSCAAARIRDALSRTTGTGLLIRYIARITAVGSTALAGERTKEQRREC